MTKLQPSEGGDAFRARGNGPIVWFRRNRKQSNHFCLYCGRFVGPGSEASSDREHLVGRNFVPRGQLHSTSVNFVFRACRKCNAAKGEAERHVSTLTLFRSPSRVTDPLVDQIAAHKASRDYHPLENGKLVADAFVNQELVVPTVLGTMKLTLVGPPQLDWRSVCFLAVRQIQALYALVTTVDPRIADLSRILPPDNVIVFGYYNTADWGNPQVLELARRTEEWDCPLRMVTAEGYFRAVLKRAEDADGGWFWGLEWNQSLRVFGAIGDPEDPPSWLVSDLPDAGWENAGVARFRREVAIKEDEDAFFEFPDDWS